MQGNWFKKIAQASEATRFLFLKCFFTTANSSKGNFYTVFKAGF